MSGRGHGTQEEAEAKAEEVPEFNKSGVITNYIDASGFYVCVGAISNYSDYGVEIESSNLPSSPVRLLRLRTWGILEAPPRDLSSMSASGRGLGILEASVFFGGCKQQT